MNFWQLVVFHAKHILKNPAYVIMTFGLPLVMVIMFGVFSKSTGGFATQDLIIVNQSEAAQPILDRLPDEYDDFIETDFARAIEQLENREVASLYLIPENYPQDSIEIKSLNGQNEDLIFQTDWAKATQAYVEEKVLSEYDIESLDIPSKPEPVLNFASAEVGVDIQLITMMILIYMMFGGSVQTSVLGQLRKTGVLKRSIASNGNSWLVLGSILLGFSLATFLLASSASIIGAIITSVPLEDIGIVLIMIAAMSIFISGLMLCLFRYIRNEITLNIVSFIVVMILIFVPFAGQSISALEPFLFIFPFHLMMTALDTGQYHLYVPLVVLLGLILFTAGSFKVEQMVKR